MNIISYTSCPLCESKAVKHSFTTKDYSISQESFEVWKCDDCTLQFTQNVPSQEDIAPYYKSEEYISHSDTKKGIVNNLYHSVRSVMLKRKYNLVNKFAKASTLLDYGCGTGYFPAYVKAQGKSVKAIEIDADARAYAKKKWNLDIYEPSALTDGTLANHSFSVISLWHVMEHLYHPEEYLKRFHQLLHNDGTLVIAVPNYTSLDAQHYGPEWAAYDVPRHLWHFSPASIVAFASKHGFDLLTKEKMPFDSFYVSLLSEKYKTGKSKLFSGFWNGFKSYNKAAKDVNQCSSIVYVFKKV
jgi:2-polyprenyl-3-methyl-5-hydroxy-6-metoxy-1,4-benzoquinol methylase